MRLFSEIFRDLAGLTGAGCITYAAYLYSVQAALVVGGLFLILLSVLTAISDVER